MTQKFHELDRRKAGAADAKRLKEKWANAYFSHRGLGAVLPPTSRKVTSIFEHLCSNMQSPSIACQN